MDVHDARRDPNSTSYPVRNTHAWESLNIDQKHMHLLKQHNMGIGLMDASTEEAKRFVDRTHEEDHATNPLGGFGPQVHRHTRDAMEMVKGNLSYILPPHCTCELIKPDGCPYPKFAWDPSCPFHVRPESPPVNARIRLLSMGPDPVPLPPGTEGWVTDVTELNGSLQIAVEWVDSPSHMNLVSPPDMFEVVHHG